MTAINRLTNKPVPIASDLLPLWNSQSGRTANTSIQSVADFTGGSINPIVGVAFTSPNLTFTFYNGSTQVIDITP